jgi:nucleoside permease NupC
MHDFKAFLFYAHVFIYNENTMKIGLFLKFIFFFAGTFLHELAHYISALSLGKAEGFSILPAVEGNRFIFGSVRSRTRYRVLSSFIACAPVIWWAVLLSVLFYFRLITINGHTPGINLALITTRIQSFSGSDLLVIWLFLQLLWAGRLSGPDIANFFKGFLSVSGLVFLSAAAAFFYFFRNYL